MNPLVPSSEAAHLHQKIDEMSRMLEEQQAARVAAEERGKLSLIDAALADHKFVNEKSRTVFQTIVRSKAKVADGEIIVDGLPLKYYVNRELAQLPGLLAGAKAGGQGSSPHESTANAFDLDDIRAGMSRAEKERAAKAIVKFLK